MKVLNNFDILFSPQLFQQSRKRWDSKEISKTHCHDHEATRENHHHAVVVEGVEEIDKRKSHRMIITRGIQETSEEEANTYIMKSHQRQRKQEWSILTS